jgi:hypothetical protein
MRRNVTSIYGVGCSVLLALACSDRDSASPRGNDSVAGAGGEVAGQGGSPAAEAGAAGVWSGGDGGARPMPTGSGAAGSDAGEAGAPIFRGGAGGEAAGNGNASGEGGASGESGANLGGEAGDESTAGAAGAPPGWVTTERRALCESICAKEPLTNGFAGAPTVPCLNNETCVDRFCGVPHWFTTRTESCLAEFTNVLICWDSLPDEAYDCGSEGLIMSDGCPMEAARMVAECY